MMPERQPAPDAAQYAALAATSEAQFREIFRRLKDVEDTSSEARDNTKEIITTLKAQNALARIEEVKSEVSVKVEALRQDMVHAFTTARNHVDAKMVETDVQFSDMDGRIEALEGLRQRGAGMATAGKWAFEIAKILMAAGAGGIFVKAIGG